MRSLYNHISYDYLQSAINYTRAITLGNSLEIDKKPRALNLDRNSDLDTDHDLDDFQIDDNGDSNEGSEVINEVGRYDMNREQVLFKRNKEGNLDDWLGIIIARPD